MHTIKVLHVVSSSTPNYDLPMTSSLLESVEVSCHTTTHWCWHYERQHIPRPCSRLSVNIIWGSKLRHCHTENLKFSQIIFEVLPINGLNVVPKRNNKRSSLAKGDITRLYQCLLSCHVMTDILGLIKPEIVPFNLPTPKTLTLNQTWSGSITRCGYHEGCIWDHHFEERGSRSWFALKSTGVGRAIQKSDSVFLYAFHCDHCAISHHFVDFTIECLRRSNQRCQSILDCSPWSRPVMLMGSAESKQPRLTNSEIIFEEFQPMWSPHLNVTSQTDGWRVNLP